MRGRRTLLIILVVIVNLAVVGYFLLRPQLTPSPDPEEELVGTPTPLPYVDVLVSAQDPIPRGHRFEYGDLAVTVEQWPAESVPFAGYFSGEEQIENMYAAQNIAKGAPILESMLSVAAVAPFPEGRVAYGLPMDMQGGLGWHIQEGDHVDVLAAMELVNVDPEFQSPLPNLYQALPDPGAENIMSLSGTYGRFETLPNGMAGIVLPNGVPFSQLVVQLTVQDAIVWHVGAQLDTVEGASANDVVAEPEGDGAGLIPLGDTGGGAPVTLPTQRGDVELVSLLVTPQDALILKYLYEVGADLDLVVRAPGDTGASITGAVWSRYILDRYQIPTDGFDLPVAPTNMRVPLELTPIATPEPEVQE